MDTIKLSNIFDIEYGNSLELYKLDETTSDDPTGINFISRTRENNGVSAIVKPILNIKPFKKGLITVAGSGNSVLESFIQPKPFYTGFHVFVLNPKKTLSEVEKLYYCYCIRQNQYKYNFGRQANRTLKNLRVPVEMPKEFKKINPKKIIRVSAESCHERQVTLDVSTWRYFRLPALFKITGSKTTALKKLQKCGPGEFPYVTTQATNNGVAGFYDFHTEEGNVLTVDSAVLGFCSYQPLNFSASDHVEKLIPLFEMNKYIAIFLTTILNLEQYRYNYGRKSCQERMEKTKIKLPSKKHAPDFQFMERYIKSLPYSRSL